MSIYNSVRPSLGNGRANNEALILDSAKVAGIDPALMFALGGSESGFKNIKNGHAGQSASGLFQITNGTMKAWKERYGRQLGIPMNANQYDAKANALLTAFAIKDYIKNIQRAGGEVNPASIYANHFLGEGGYRQMQKLLNTNPNAPVSVFMDSSTIAVNKPYTMRNGRVVSVKEMYDILAFRMGKHGAKGAVATKPMPSTYTPTSVGSVDIPMIGSQERLVQQLDIPSSNQLAITPQTTHSNPAISISPYIALDSYIKGI